MANSQKTIDTNAHISKTTELSLEARINILRQIIAVTPEQYIYDDKDAKKLRKALIAEGYEPMMFSQALRVWRQEG